jgi:predicted dienelactone hydrolase
MKSMLLLLAFTLILHYPVLSQPFLTGHFQQTFIDSSRNNRSIPAEVYYPADQTGSNVPVASSGGQFPVVVFGHGFVMTWSAYENIWLPLTSNGYIAVFPTTESGISPSHSAFAQDLAFLVTAIQAEGNSSSSLLYNRVASTSAVMGHSMGGGSSFLAVQYNSNITAVLNLAAAETNPSAITACQGITIPALVIAGANDCITPPSGHQLPMYSALSSSCKTYISITGGSHCQFANNNFNCSLGELTCSPSAAITRAQQHALVNQLMIPWLDYQLKNDCNAGILFENLVSTPAGFTVQKNCVLCIPSAVPGNYSSYGFLLYPTPADDYVTLLTDPLTDSPVEIRIFNTHGKKVMHLLRYTNQNNEIKIQVSSLSVGLYFIQLNAGSNKSSALKFLKK